MGNTSTKPSSAQYTPILPSEDGKRPTVEGSRRIPISPTEDYKWWVEETKGSRSAPYVWIRDGTKTRGWYHYRQGCAGAANRVELNNQYIRQRPPCVYCYNHRPKPIVLNPPVYNSPEGYRLGIQPANVLSAEKVAALGPLAERTRFILLEMNELGRATRAAAVSAPMANTKK